MEAAYLIDANLPFAAPVWKNENFQFVVKIDPSWDDEEIWKYAKDQKLIIVTKDKDFIVKQITAGIPPKVIHVKFGNLKLKDFITRIHEVWPEVERFIKDYSTVNIYLNKIEAIK
ncbi:MAG TPA: DUF5615 family PIN-like protein [Flavisolibacter sp.]|jgi:predicted nuclease of predicted toxin-antitoxin system|nr:DUF5615 family PIN-like protein [Flavisolibacter sp.]